MFGFFRRSPVNTLSPTEVAPQVAAGSIALVDVREANEWAQGHIAGAIHLPLSRLRERAADLPKDKPVVFYCLSGGRSGQAVATCQSLGLPHDTHMAGGISAWKAHSLPIAR